MKELTVSSLGTATTVPQRKQCVARFLSALGFVLQQNQIRQQAGVLYACLPVPFTEEQFLQLENLGRDAAVIFVPKEDQAEVAEVEVVFEQERGWFFAVPISRTYHPIVSRKELEELLRWYSLANKQAVLEEMKAFKYPKYNFSQATKNASW